MASSYTTIPELTYAAQICGIPLYGVATKDKIARYVNGRGGYIVNLQDSTDGSGTHWTCFYLENGRGIYFDSYGGPAPNVVVDILYRYCPLGWSWNNQIIQNLRSGYCGQYCLYFLWWMSNHKGSLKERLRSFQQIWDDDPEKNLTLLKERFVNKLKRTPS